MANDKKYLDELEGDYGESAGTEGFTLESILAEFKGSAFMEGERKTPSDELQRKTDDILREVLGETARPDTRAGAGEISMPASEPQSQEELDEYFSGPEFGKLVEEQSDVRDPEPDEPPRRGLFGKRRRRDAEAEPEPDRAGERPGRGWAVPANNVEEPPEPAYEDAPEIDQSVFDEPDGQEEPDRDARIEKFYDSIRNEKFRTDLNGDGSFDDGDTDSAIEEGERESGEDERLRRRGLLGLFGRRDSRDDGEDEDDGGNGDYGDGYPEEGEEDYDDGIFFDLEPEPDFRTEAARFAARVPSLRFRILGAAVITALMILVTHFFTAGKSIPIAGTDIRACTGMLTVMELCVAALGLDVLIRGFEDILTMSPGAESLVFVSCVMSVIDGFVMLATGRVDRGLPMSVISAVSLTAAMSARKSWYMAVCDSLKGARASSTVSGVAVDPDGPDNRRILKKVSDAQDGFWYKLSAPDFGEGIYDQLAPLLVITSFVLAFLSTVAHGEPADFAHSFSILTAVSAAFPATAVFALPFKYAASNLKKAGGALAGYEGARDIYWSDGALITDTDIFPLGSVSLSGLKVFEGVTQQRVITAASSLIIASDSGLARVYEELLKNQGLLRKRVDEFSCYDGGGIGGVVEGERVLVGTGAFMNLMGIRVPENMNSPSSVFTAINGELAGVFTLNYVPSNSVQSALVALLNTRTNLLMAVRDFNVTPNTVKQKFKVSMDGVENLPIETAYSLSQNVLPEGAGVSAVLCRGGLAPFAETITRGRLLKVITELNTCVSAIGTAIAVIIMFFLCWTGAFAAASAENILIFMSVIGIAVYIMSQGTRGRMR